MDRPIITNYQDLIKEKIRLKTSLKASKTNLKQSFEELKGELNPLNAIGKATRNALHPNSANPLVQFGMKNASEFIFGKLLLKRAGWLPKLIVPFLVKEVATRVIGTKTDKKMASLLKSFAEMIRKTTIPKGSKPITK